MRGLIKLPCFQLCSLALKVMQAFILLRILMTKEACLCLELSFRKLCTRDNPSLRIPFNTVELGSELWLAPTATFALYARQDVGHTLEDSLLYRIIQSLSTSPPKEFAAAYKGTRAKLHQYYDPEYF